MFRCRLRLSDSTLSRKQHKHERGDGGEQNGHATIAQQGQKSCNSKGKRSAKTAREAGREGGCNVTDLFFAI
jgi:hypothetical protein